MKVRVLLSLGVMVVCVGLTPASEGLLVRLGVLSNDNGSKTTVQDNNPRLPDPVPQKGERISPPKGETIPAPKTEVSPRVPAPVPSNTITPIPTTSTPPIAASAPLAPIPVTIAESPCGGNCAAEAHGDCWDRLCEWACFRIDKAPCGKGCEPCCRPPLYMYFLDQCAGCKPLNPPVTSCHPAIASPIAPVAKPAPPAFAPSPNKQGICTKS